MMKQRHQNKGFTITELVIAVAITGTLSAVALPYYFGNIKKTRQNAAVSEVSRVQTTISAYAMEFTEAPKNWLELGDISAIMTTTGPAESKDWSSITLPGGHYTLTVEQKNNYYYILKAESNDNLNVIGCMNLANAASDIAKGTDEEKAEAPNCGEAE